MNDPEGLIVQDRLALLDTITLKLGGHSTAEDGMCAEEFISFLAGEPHSDHPVCVSPVLRDFTISLNDQWTTEQRQKLKPYLVAQIGTAGDGQDEARAYLALDWLIRVFTPAWLDLAGLTAEATTLRDLRRIVDLVSATAADPVVMAAQTKARSGCRTVRQRTVRQRTAALGAAGGGAALDAAWGATGGGAARGATRTAAWGAAWGAALGAALGATWDATGDALQPTVDTLQAAALDLLGAMTDPSKATGAEQLTAVYPWDQPATVAPAWLTDCREYFRRTAWDQAMALYTEWTSTLPAPGGAGWRDPHKAHRNTKVRTELDALVVKHGFQGTYVDPVGLSWMERRATPSTYPGDQL